MQDLLTLARSLLWVAFLVWVKPASADVTQSDLCERAAAGAASEIGVPLEVMQAITLIETGREQDGRTRPWPWAVNDGTQGHWFSTQEAALSHVRSLIDAGRQSFDLGCFQLNFRWHSGVFSSVEAMMDPTGNARHAARFLKELYAEMQDWTLAAGAYHSRTPIHAERYRNRFTTALAAMPPKNLTPVAAARPNKFPLLQGGKPSGVGSLVPVQPPRNALLLTARTRMFGG